MPPQLAVKPQTSISGDNMTTFSVETELLKGRVAFAKNALGSSKTDPAVTSFLMTLKAGILTVFAANKEMFAQTELRVEGADDADQVFCVNGPKLTSLLTYAESERMTFSISEDSVDAQAASLRVNLPLVDSAVLRQISDGHSEWKDTATKPIDRASLVEALTCGKSCTTANSVRPDVTHVEIRDGRLLSSDGRKILVYAHDGFNEEIKFKCPASILTSALNCCKNITAEAVEIGEGAAWYYIKGQIKAFVVGIRKVERDFPAVEGQIEAASTPADDISIDKNVLEAAVRGVSTGIDNDDVRITLKASGAETEATLTVTAKNSLGKTSEESASAGRTAKEDIAFPISYKHLLDTLGVFKGDSVVDMSVMSDRNVLLVQDNLPTRQVMTLIPFRTDEQIEREAEEARQAEEARKKAAADRAAESDSQETNDEMTAAAIDSEQDDIDL